MTVKLDGTQILATSVPATAWTDYGANVAVPAGVHGVSVSFDNDYKNATCDRNLRVDKVSFSAASSTPPTTQPPTQSGQWKAYQGFNFQGWKSDTYLQPGAATSFDQMITTGLNAASINTIWFQSSGTANTMFRDANETATDEGVIASLRRADAAGLQTMLRPMVNTYSNSTWRGNFRPTNVAEWFTNYRRMTNHYATLAQANGVDLYDIGSEFNSLQGYDAEWRKVAAEARARYSGKLTYSANWDSYQNVSWYDAVDIVGIDAYFPLAANGANPTVDEIIARWSSYPEGPANSRNIIAGIAAVQQRFNRPVVFTEIGYRSGASPLYQPWNIGGAYAPAEQQRALEAAFRAWDGKPWFLGMFIWMWNADPNGGGSGDTQHTPQRKPAEQTVRTRYTAI